MEPGLILHSYSVEMPEAPVHGVLAERASRQLAHPSIMPMASSFGIGTSWTVTVGRGTSSIANLSHARLSAMGDPSGGRLSIRELCSNWKKAATASGGIAIGTESEQFRLHRNGVKFHDLTYPELREATVGLHDILLLPGMNTVIDLDHSLLWSWLAELLLGGNGPLSLTAEPEIARLAEATMRAALANVRAPTRKAFDQARAASELLYSNSRQFLVAAHTVLPYLAFPLLEAVCRRACAVFLDLRGTVLQPFPRRNGTEYTVGQRCSNVADVLALLVDAVARPGLAADVNDILDHVATFATNGGSGPGDGYAVLFDWRNSSLHGETSLTTIGGTVLSLTLLIALDGIADQFSSVQAGALVRAQREVDGSQMSGRWQPSPWSYYPPFL